MTNKYRIKRVSPDEHWDNFIRTSENGSVFSYGDYLTSLPCQLGCYFIYNKDELRGALIVIEDENETVLHDFIIYNGIIFGPPTNGQNHSQRTSEHFRLTEFVAQELLRMYHSVALSLHPSIIDIRPFLWVNYGTDLPKYNIQVRYTSYLDIQDFFQAHTLEDIKIYNNASGTRRQEIRYAKRDGVETKEEFDPNCFVNLYARTIGRQKIEIPENRLKEMRNLITNLHQKSIGRMFIAKTTDGKIGSMAFFVTDQWRSYFLFGANDPEIRNKHTGTAVLWDAFSILSRDGIIEVDLEGVNSPNRGWFKMSFGGDLRPYFEITYKS